MILLPRINKAVAIFITLVCVAGSINNVDAQQTKKKKYYDWGNLGFGYSDQKYFSDITGTNYGFDYNLLVKQIFFQGAVTGYFKTSNSSPNIDAISLGVGYGVGYYSHFMVALSIGAAYTSGYYFYVVDSTQTLYSKNFRTIGATPTIQIIGKPGDDYGFGLEVYGVFNKYVKNVGLRFVFNISTKPSSVKQQ
mgnify:FL=1